MPILNCIASYIHSLFIEKRYITVIWIFRPELPVSPIFSLQINPLPDAKTLKETPIMMTFDVVRQ